MKELTIVLALAIISYLSYDNYSKKAALEEVTARLETANERIVELGRTVPLTKAEQQKANWFQDRLTVGATKLDRTAGHR